MSTFSLSHLTDAVLLRDLAALVAKDRSNTAALVAHIAEVDARKLYLAAAHPSMYDYCVQELQLSEDSSKKRIQAARIVRRFPIVLSALADGRIHLSTIVMLAAHLTADNADHLLRSVTHKSKAEIGQILAECCPRLDLAADTRPVIPADALDQGAPGHPALKSSTTDPPAHTVGNAAPALQVQRITPQRHGLYLLVGQDTRDKLRYAQDLLSHQVPRGDLAKVFDRALDALIRELEKSKFAATDRPRSSQRSTRPGSRHVPAGVKRAVWERDQGQCTFVSEAGRRCPSRTRLEFDHATEVARGGQSTVTGIRLRCRAHNQFTAERTFGREFMNHKREEARHRAASPRQAMTRDVIAAMRTLGYRLDEARRAATYSESNLNASLEGRVRSALSYLCPRVQRQFPQRSAFSATA